MAGDMAMPGDGHDAEIVDFASNRATRPKPEKLDQEVGVSSPLPFTTFEDFMQSTNSRGKSRVTINTNPVSLDQLTEMRRKDGTIRALLRLFQLPIMKATLDSSWIEPEDQEGGGEETEFVNLMWSLPPNAGGMSVTRTKFMRQVLLALLEGFSAFEMVPTYMDEGALKGKYVIKKMAHRAARTVRFIVDDNGGFDGYEQVVPNDGTRKRIERNRAWYYAVNEEENPFYGVSMFEAAWHHWDIKRKLYYISHIAAQMAAVPGRIGYYPPGTSANEVNQFAQKLANFAFNTSLTLEAPVPNMPGWKVDRFEGASQFDFMKLIDHQNQQIVKSVLAKFLEDADRQVLIQSGQADASADFFVMGIESVLSEISESMTYYMMPPFIDFNFDTKMYPQFKFGVLSDATKDVIKDLFIAVVTAQTTQWTPEIIRELEKKMTERLGLEVDYQEVEAREEEQAAEQRKLTEAYYAGQEQQAAPASGSQPGDQSAPGGTPEAVAASSAGEVDLEQLNDLVAQAHLVAELAKSEEIELPEDE